MIYLRRPLTLTVYTEFVRIAVSGYMGAHFHGETVMLRMVLPPIVVPPDHVQQPDGPAGPFMAPQTVPLGPSVAQQVVLPLP